MPAAAPSALWVLNPNTTAAMTAAVQAQVRALVPPGVAVHGSTAQQGAPVIDSAGRFAAAAAALPAQVAADVPPAAAVLLACFGDPGLESLRGLRRPVAGLAEAAVAEAVAAGQRFAIVTAGAAWVPLLQQRVADFGATPWLAGVFALPFNGLRLVQDPAGSRAALQAVVAQAERSGAQALVLGGAAFAGLRDLVPTRLVLIEPVAAATRALLRG
ncbi:aspartate/glutamate racemase family protein [Rubrivivax sp. RP6-9]|uniref:aspartate/glutamate racemase family protein n=1 Tax=Rubrivivax sp. RP6-9 TaxID=3415750 RepID=UPI003CC6C48A